MRIRNFFLFLFIILQTKGEEVSPLLQKILSSESWYVSVSSGFLGYRTFDLIGKLITSNDANKKPLIWGNLAWNMGKINFKGKAKFENGKMEHAITLKIFGFNYGNYLIKEGDCCCCCCKDYPAEDCILRRSSILNLGYGLEFAYFKKRKHTLLHNVSFYLALIAKKIPIDVIISYSPIIWQYKLLSVELNAINFSISEFINSFIMSFSSKQNTNDSEKYKEKCKDINDGKISKAKFIIVDNILKQFLYNITVNIGFNFDLLS